MSNVIDFSPIAAKLPVNPSKWDIIPIHSTDRATFKFCRRQWVWSSPSHMNLIRKASVLGIDKNLWFGTGIHHALERYYHPGLREDPWIAFETWFDLQWRGGEITADELKQFADREPQPIHPHSALFKVSGLVDILPDTHLNEELFLGLKDLGIGMMKFYKDYAEANDNFSVILVEHDFSVPVLNSKGEPLYAVDRRMMPDGWEPNFDEGNEFGPYMKEVASNTVLLAHGDTDTLVKQVHVRGRQDLIVQDNEYGRYGIIDHKTTSRLDEDYFRHLELDEQCTSYLSFGELEARIHGLEHKNLEYITYQALLKGYPKPPSVLKNGTPSLSKTTETTTAKLFEQFIADSGLKPWFDLDAKAQNYYAWLLETGDERFIQRTQTWRNKVQRQNAMIRLHAEARDMLDPDMVAYPNPSKNYNCLNCIFRGPCIQAESGDDYVATLEDGYMPNWDR